MSSITIIFLLHSSNLHLILSASAPAYQRAFENVERIPRLRRSTTRLVTSPVISPTRSEGASIITASPVRSPTDTTIQGRRMLPNVPEAPTESSLIPQSDTSHFTSPATEYTAVTDLDTSDGE